MKNPGIEGIRISEGSGSGLGSYSKASKEIGEKVIVCCKVARW